MGGKWNVADGQDSKPYASIWEQVKSMTIDGARYIRSSFFGGIVLVKASAAIVFGASDVLNVSFAERDGEENSTLRLGAVFAVSGLGCIVGPLLADLLMGPKPTANSLQIACIWSFLAMAVGYLGLGLTSKFSHVCLFSAVRAVGGSVLWIDSSVILQVRFLFAKNSRSNGVGIRAHSLCLSTMS